MKTRLEAVQTRQRMEKTQEAASISREEKMAPKLGSWGWGRREVKGLKRLSYLG